MENEIKNEVRVIDKLSANGGHDNIVTVLNHGWLNDNRYFFDMELCIFNLEDYILSCPKEILGSPIYFDPSSMDDDLGCLSLWGIIKQISSGINYIHSHHEIHRDLKPRNSNTRTFAGLTLSFLVLLSLPDAAWKITDFGLSAEGTSRLAYSTRFARGTECYRAPEMVKEGSVVSMKSDIFAVGCIFYELVYGRKAFSYDYHVFEYTFTKQKPETPLLPERVDERLQSYITQMLHAALEVDWWKRPSARDLLQVLNYLIEEATEVYILSGVTGAFGQRLHLHRNDQRWRVAQWKRCWYVTCSLYQLTNLKHTMYGSGYILRCPPTVGPSGGVKAWPASPMQVSKCHSTFV